MANNAWNHPPPFWDYMNGFEGPRGPGRRNGPPPPPGSANHWADLWTHGNPAMWNYQGFGGRRHRGPRPDVFFDHFEEGDLNATDDENTQENDTEKTVTPDTPGEPANAAEDVAAQVEEPRRRGLGGRGGRGRGRGMGGRGLGRGRVGMRRHHHNHHHHEDEDVPMLSDNDLTPTSSDEEVDAEASADPEKTGLTEDESANEQTPRDFARHGRGRGRGLGRGRMGGRGRGRGGLGGRGGFTNVRVNVPGWQGEHGVENGERHRARHMHGHGHGHGHGADHHAQRRQQWMDMMIAQGYGPFGGPHHHQGPIGRHHGPPGFGGPGRFNGPHGFGGMFNPHAREIPAEESAGETQAVHGKNKNKDKKEKKEKKDKKNKKQHQHQEQEQQPTETPENDQATNDQHPGGFQVNARGKFPAIDIFDCPEAYEIHANVPGASKDDIEINWNPKTSRLIITGTIAPAGDEEFLTTRSKNERKVGDFKRRVLLGQEGTPANIVAENITARVEDGVLRVVVPKAEADLVHVEKADME